MKKYIFIIVLTVIPLLTIQAQGTDPNPRDPGPGVPPAIPLDGGLSVLLVAGGIYGAKKLRDFNRKE